MNRSPLKLRMDPAPAKWAALGAASGPEFAKTPSSAKQRFREQAGLPNRSPLVLSGHQAELWHPGILAKMFASVVFAEYWTRAQKIEIEAAWLVVDQDEADHVGMRIPVRDASGNLRVADWRWAEMDGRTSAGVGVVTPPSLRLKAGETPAIQDVSDGIVAIQSAIADSAKGSSNWAQQVSLATQQLLKPIVQTPRFAFESSLDATDLFQKIAEAMASDATQVIRAYNAAVLAVPEAGMRPLDESKGELPLWSVASGVRRRVFAPDFAKLDRARLAPRGLLMTAIMRLAGCELFIHGTGGALYDRATEAWVRAWTGELKKIADEFGGVHSLAPITMVTADLLLPLATEAIPSETEIAKGVWLAHHAKHDPLILGDKDGALAKAQILESIGARKRRGEHPAREFAALHELLAQSRLAGSGEIERLGSEASVLRSRRAEAAIAHDRTWSFALHSPEAIREMFEACRGAWQV